MYVTASKGICRLPNLAKVLGSEVFYKNVCTIRDIECDGVVVWGRRPSSSKGKRLAASLALPLIHLEDGFLRSFGTGRKFAPLSIVVDDVGIYYDATRPSRLEQSIQDKPALSECASQKVRELRRRIVEEGLGKYNDAPLSELPHRVLSDSRKKVLVVDQTAGDVSVKFGLASEESFEDALLMARRQNPGALIIIKTHPEVSNGTKSGYLSDVSEDCDTVVLRESYQAAKVIDAVDSVYVVTSHFGFEALLRDKPVTCLGMPWYGGWGVTTDVASCYRRTARRSVDELFSAAYLDYSRYLNPTNGEAGSIYDVIEWLTRQRKMGVIEGRTICVGFRRWKARNVSRFLGLDPKQIFFVRDSRMAADLNVKSCDRLVFWGAQPPLGVAELASDSGARLVRMEDGFIRSVGLGSDYVPARSMVLDEVGIYFDPRYPSALENLLNSTEFSAEQLTRAAKIRKFIIDNKITKYNTERDGNPAWKASAAKIIFVPGQVEDDASIRFGCGAIRTNSELLKAVRNANPDAFIVYKPHPDVVAKNRTGKLSALITAKLANHVELIHSVVSCIDASTEVHTMTSLCGFDALIRRKRVVVYGRPFYSGWGLTDDKLIIDRRARKLSLDQLVAGALILYPIYWDETLPGYTTCEAVLNAIKNDKVNFNPKKRLSLLARCANFIKKISMFIRCDYKLMVSK